MDASFPLLRLGMVVLYDSSCSSPSSFVLLGFTQKLEKHFFFP